MAKGKHDDEQAVSQYRTMLVSDLRMGRRGKHHDLVNGILEELDNLAEGSAMIIPLDDIGGVSLANLRSAVSRATKSRGIACETYSDDKSFYIWKQKAGSQKQSFPKATKTSRSRSQQ
jgi:hypothetical protein